MMNNLFSMFDPSSSYMSLNWYILMVPFMVMLMLSKKTNKTKKMMTVIFNKIKKEMENMMISKKNLSLNLMVTMFLVILMVNMLALVPFNFTPTAHMSVSMVISMTLWLSIMLWGWLNSFKKMMIHMTPMGTPSNLMNFMVMIELVSNIIRPITLSVRLTANMVAGHLLVSLLSNFSLMETKKSAISVVFMLSLAVLELMVAMVQAYVMTTLLTLYHNESM